jgi:phosphoribosylformylglycinamidine cyclo-ligase
VLQQVRAMAHITGGGIPGNLNRALPDHLDAEVDARSWHVPNVFRQLQHAGDVPGTEMLRAFNLGVGMVVIAAPEHVDAVLAASAKAGLTGWQLGRVVRGGGKVQVHHLEDLWA